MGQSRRRTRHRRKVLLAVPRKRGQGPFCGREVNYFDSQGRKIRSKLADRHSCSATQPADGAETMVRTRLPVWVRILFVLSIKDDEIMY